LVFVVKFEVVFRLGIVFGLFLGFFMDHIGDLEKKT